MDTPIPTAHCRLPGVHGPFLGGGAAEKNRKLGAGPGEDVQKSVLILPALYEMHDNQNDAAKQE